MASLRAELLKICARWPAELDFVGGFPARLREEIAQCLAERVSRVIDLPKELALP